MVPCELGDSCAPSPLHASWRKCWPFLRPWCFFEKGRGPPFRRFYRQPSASMGLVSDVWSIIKAFLWIFATDGRGVCMYRTHSKPVDLERSTAPVSLFGQYSSSVRFTQNFTVRESHVVVPGRILVAPRMIEGVPNKKSQVEVLEEFLGKESPQHMQSSSGSPLARVPERGRRDILLS